MRAILGILWIADALLQAQPALFGGAFWRENMAGVSMGEPALVRRSILWAAGLAASHPALWNTAFVVTELALGAALLSGRWARLALVVSVPWALVVWWFGEGLGMLPTGFATLATGAPGPVLLYPLVGLLAWPGRADHEGVATRPGLALWAALWAGLSVLELPLVFPVGQVLRANLAEAGGGLPRWQQPVANAVARLSEGHPAATAAALAAVQLAVGLGALRPAWRRTALVVGTGVAGVFWLCFQFLGGIAAGGATDPSSGPLLALLALALLPAGRETRPVGRAAGRGARPFVLSPLQRPQLAVAHHVDPGSGRQHPQ